MSGLIVYGFVALVFVVFLGVQVWLHFSRPRSLALAPSEQLVPVDLEAFENLTDPDEEQYLRTSLSQREFRRVQRTRLRAARLYVAALSRNADVLVAAGEAARLNPDPEVAVVGQELFDRALRLKFFCLFSVVRMQAAFVFPVLLSPSHQLARQYMTVSYLAANLPGKAAA
jgi:hypothetical protein